jgi:hypothetical protein
VRRRKQMRQALLARIAERQRVKFGAANLFTTFPSIQHAIGEVAQALIDGRIDLKVAGRMAIQLQTASKMLWLIKRSEPITETRGHGEKEGEALMIAGAVALKDVVPFASSIPDREALTPRSRFVCRKRHPEDRQRASAVISARAGLRDLALFPFTDSSKHRVPRSYSAADENAASFHGARDDVSFWRTRHRGTLKRTFNRSRRKVRYPSLPGRSSPRAGPNHNRHLSSSGLSFSPHFAPGFWHNGSCSGVLWTLVERQCFYGIRFSIEGRNTS